MRISLPSNIDCGIPVRCCLLSKRSAAPLSANRTHAPPTRSAHHGTTSGRTKDGVSAPSSVTFCSGMPPVVAANHHSIRLLQEQLWWYTSPVVALYPYKSESLTPSGSRIIAAVVECQPSVVGSGYRHSTDCGGLALKTVSEMQFNVRLGRVGM